MKKYFEVARATFKAQIAYRYDVFIGVIVSFFRVILAYIMWSAIFLDKKEIGGAETMMDFPAIWAAAPKSGMRYGIVEIEEYSFDQFTSCQKSIEWLNQQTFVVMPK